MHKKKCKSKQSKSKKKKKNERCKTFLRFKVQRCKVYLEPLQHLRFRFYVAYDNLCQLMLQKLYRVFDLSLNRSDMING